MNQFKFAASHKAVTYGMMGLGVLCLLITFLIDDELHTRFWSNYLHNTVFFTGVAFISLFIMSAFITAWAGWYVTMKRVWEAYALFLIPGLALMLVLIIGLWGGFHHLYHWADAEAVATDKILQHKSAFLNKGWYTFGTLIIMGVWIFFAMKLRQLSLDEDQYGTTEYKYHHKMRIWAAAFLPLGGFTSAALVWQWVMSVDAHWYSTLYAWYTGASWFVSAMALTILTVIFLKFMGYLEAITEEHLHDMGKYLFAFSIFWTYLWFSQYMLIWYANVGEETVYFQTRQREYPVLFYGNLIINFLVPFFVLMRNDTKRKYGTLVFVSAVVLIGHWLDFFQMIKPGVLHTAHEVMAHGHDHAHGEEAHHAFMMGFHFPGLLEIGTMIGFLGLFIYFVFSRLEKASFEPKNDPYLAESLQHHV
ncbi:MAG TPA: hypothetical protein PKC76_01570 [Saprospiraceae bacterium]|mgnify:CR=1 FL=1|nr:hypothetical protein [Saprospiraceae bacterium]HMP22784.1 hypothetical protein [Saprospiraceae bacterium]